MADGADIDAGDVDPRDAVEVLGQPECWRLLGTADVMRLAVAVGDQVEIFPVNPVVDGESLVFRTAPGTKLAAVAVAHRVAVEADGFLAGTRQAWSVVVKGTAEVLEHFTDIYAAQRLPVQPWSTGTKDDYVRVLPDTVTGRLFRVLPGRGPAGAGSR